MQNQTKESKMRPCSILPIGLVNLTTGKNARFGTIWNCWAEKADSVHYVVEDQQKRGTFKAVYSSGRFSADVFYIGAIVEFQHDQTFSRIGGYCGWRIVGIVPHTKQGLLQIKAITGKSSVAFATFK